MSIDENIKKVQNEIRKEFEKELIDKKKKLPKGGIGEHS